MKQFILATVIILSMSGAYAGSSMMLHVYFDSDASGPTGCDGTIDTSKGCPLPILGN